MNKLEAIKQEIINDYSNWVEEAIKPLTDNIGIKNIAVDNFKLKLDKLIEYVTKTEP